MTPMADRAVFFVDGNNWYHSLGQAGLEDRGRLKYPRIFEKLSAPRTWKESRYYIPDVGIMGSPALLNEQRDFLAQLRAQDKRITVHMGRLEQRSEDNEAAKELLRYLGNLKTRIPTNIFHDLLRIGKSHAPAQIYVEKAVDVQIAVDMVMLAVASEFDTAYLLSADGDFTPAVEAVQKLGKKVFAVSPSPGAKLAACVSAFIRLKPDWFDDCYRGRAPQRPIP